MRVLWDGDEGRESVAIVSLYRRGSGSSLCTSKLSSVTVMSDVVMWVLPSCSRAVPGLCAVTTPLATERILLLVDVSWGL